MQLCVSMRVGTCVTRHINQQSPAFVIRMLQCWILIWILTCLHLKLHIRNSALCFITHQLFRIRICWHWHCKCNHVKVNYHSHETFTFKFKKNIQWFSKCSFPISLNSCLLWNEWLHQTIAGMLAQIAWLRQRRSHIWDGKAKWLILLHRNSRDTWHPIRNFSVSKCPMNE